MRILFVTQKIDKDDAVLGAYHGWVIELAKHFEQVLVICLFEGRHEPPVNVRVYSLGKESGRRATLAYAIRFIWLVWKLRRTYDAAFVHMNQEYLLVGGLLWKFLGKPVYMWRNHYAGSFLTDFAAAFCTKVFCTSMYSYTAKYRKTVRMPVGVDTRQFSPDPRILRAPRSILFLSRIAPSKRPELFIEALGILLDKGVSFLSSVYGSPSPEDTGYYESLKYAAEILGMQDRVQFFPSVPNHQTPDIYRAHDVFVNCSPSGMFDKTLFEAAGTGCLVLASSDDFKAAAGERFHFETAQELAARLEEMLSLSKEERVRASDRLAALSRAESLATLGDRLAVELLL